jgi:hypothetical protein
VSANPWPSPRPAVIESISTNFASGVAGFATNSSAVRRRSASVI